MGFLSAETLNVNNSAVFTVPSGCTFLLVKMAHNSGVGLPSTRTLGGTALTLIAGGPNDDGMSAGVYQRVSPTIGANTLSHNSGAATNIATLEYYDGIDLVTPVRNSATAFGTYTNSFSLNVTSVAGDLCSDMICHQSSGTLTMNGAQTLVVNTTFGTRLFGVSRRAATGTSTNFSWTTSASQRQRQVAVALIPSGGGGGSAIAAISSGYHTRNINR
jgi:hypothetical protein